MADNQVIIDLIGRSDFQKPIREVNQLRLSIEELQKVAARIPMSQNFTLLSAGGLDQTSRGLRQLKSDIQSIIPMINRMYIADRGFQTHGLLESLAIPQTKAARLIGSPYTSGISSYTTYRSNRVPGVYDMVQSGPNSFMPPALAGGGGGGLANYYGSGGGGGGLPPGGGGGGGQNGRFNFGQIFSGFLFLQASRSITKFVEGSVKQFADYELAVKRISIVSDQSSDDISKGILELSKVIPFSIDEISKSFLVAGQAGLKSAEQIKDVSFAAGLLSFKFGDDLSDSTKKLIQITNQFNLSIGQSGALVGLLSKVSGDTLADVDSLSTALTRAGATAKAANLSIFETVTALGAAAQSGIENQRAGTELRRLITELEKISSGSASSQRQNLAQRLFGPNFREDLNIAKVGLSGVVDKLAQMNIRASDLSVLVGDIPARILSGLVVFSQKLKESGDSLSSLQDRFKEGKLTIQDYESLFGSLNSQQQIFQNRLDELKIKVGEAFKPIAEIGIVVLGGLAEFFKKIPPDILVMGIALTALTTAFIGLSLILPVIVGSLQGIGIALGGGFLGGLLSFGFYGLIATAAISGLARETLVFNAAIKAGNDPMHAFGISLFDIVRQLNPLMPLMEKLVKLFLSKLPKKDRDDILNFFDQFQEKMGFKKVDTSVIDTTSSLKMLVDQLKKVNDEQTQQQLQKLIDQINKVQLATKSAAQEFNNFQYIVHQKTIASQEDFQKLVDGMIPTWTDAIFDLITGAKTFGDVWRDIQNQALKDFIHGFLEGMIGSWNEAMGKMLAQYLFFAQNTGQSAGGGAAGIFGGLGGLFGGGGGGGAVSSAFNLGSIISGLPQVPAAPSVIGLHAKGGIATKPTLGVFGEAGPEALIPLDRLENSNSKTITIVNVVDRNFVHQTLADDPDVIINSINADLIRNGTTRKTIRRYA